MGQGDELRDAVAVDGHDDVLPLVAAGIVLEAIGHHRFGSVDKFEVLAHKVGIAQTERRVLTTQFDEAAIVVVGESLHSRGAGPVDGVDGVGGIVGVVHHLLRAQHFFTGLDEGDTLRGEHHRLRHQVEFEKRALGGAHGVDGGTETVGEAHVVVAGHVGDELVGLCCPRRFGVVDSGIVDLRVVDTTDNAKLDALLETGASVEEGRLAVVAEGPAQGITEFVAEGRNAGHVLHGLLHGRLPLGKLRCFGCPTLTVDEHIGVDAFGSGADGAHGFDVVDAHEVEAEAIDVVFLHPVLHTLHHEAAHHGTFRSRLVATARSIGRLAFGVGAVEVAGYGALKVGAGQVVRVVVDHIEHHFQAVVVERFDHLLKLKDARLRVGRVGGVRPFGHVVVERIVAPVVLRIVELALINRSKVKRREKMHVRHAQLLQVVDAGGLPFGRFRTSLREGKKFSFVLNARCRGNTEIAVVHFVDDDVLLLRGFVAFPAIGVGGAQVDDGAALAIEADRLGVDARGFTEPLVVFLHIEGVELPVLVARQRHVPRAVGSALHVERLDGLSAASGSIEVEHHLACRGRPELELRAGAGVGHFGQVTLRHRILIVGERFHLLSRGQKGGAG